jgi:K+-sensing histidine kinase KdpD
VRERFAHRVVRAIEALLAVARERDRLQAQVVETQALRRSDELKAALLRAVSHDLPSPPTAILTAAVRFADGITSPSDGHGVGLERSEPIHAESSSHAEI